MGRREHFFNSSVAMESTTSRSRTWTVPRTFQGNAAGEQIEFVRDGVKESLRATNGAETGMKWLIEKSDCLTVRAGEGYCAD